MVNCAICREPDAQLRVCSKDATHLVHLPCLQQMLDGIAWSMRDFNCPSCPNREPLLLRFILSYENQGLTIQNKTKLIIEYSKRQVLANLSSDKMIV